jgi:hypothetical protein
VVETVLDARRLGFPVTVLASGIRAVDLEPGDGERAIERMRAAGVDPGRALRDCDSHRALHASGDLVVTGATVTNVGDLWMAWRPR